MIAVTFLKMALSMPGCGTIREKRRIVKGILSRVRSRFNVSCAEIEDIDQITTSVLGFTVCGAETALQRVVLERVRAFVERNVDAEVADVLFVVPAFVDDVDESIEAVMNRKPFKAAYDVFVETPGEVLLSKVIKTFDGADESLDTVMRGGDGDGEWIPVGDPDEDELAFFTSLFGLDDDEDWSDDDDDDDDDSGNH